ncbi:MAG TPA: ribosome maturation factor RimP, partial [Thermodesulfobacteriota bacterium]|nr:ribosome maturation factor RimP [Thermodesulfobacteriota bacterium]
MAHIPEEAFNRIKALAETLLQEEKMELADMELLREGRGWVLRLFIDKTGGVTLDDCASVSRQFGDQLEVEDLIPFRYTLEVSSPGLDRPLKKDRDFLRHIGNQIQVVTRSPWEGRSFFKGEMLAYQVSG